MALTESTMAALGTKMPVFELPDVRTGATVSSGQFAGKKAVLVMFICRHCPYVVHVKDELPRLGQDFQPRDVGVVAISCNDAGKYPLDAPPQLREMAKDLGFSFPLCYDESQAVGKAFTAACTPDFFLYDKDCRLVYRGQLDDSRPGNGKPVTGRDVRSALEALLTGKEISKDQKPSAGCNIKWKAGNEPNYYLR